MSYSELQQRAYAEMQWKLEEFKKIKDSLKTTKCRVHNKRIRVGDSWEEEYAVNVYISKYCCEAFADEIRRLFVERGIFNSVIIEK